VTAIFAQMRGDTVGATFDRKVRGSERIRMHATARVPQRRDVIDVDPET
jgi:hypothetical protein